MISRKFICKVLNNPPHRQTNQQTDKLRPKHNLLGGDNERKTRLNIVFDALYSESVNPIQVCIFIAIKQALNIRYMHRNNNRLIVVTISFTSSKRSQTFRSMIQRLSTSCNSVFEMEKYCWHINHETKLPDTIPEITSKFKCNYTN